MMCRLVPSLVVMAFLPSLAFAQAAVMDHSSTDHSAMPMAAPKPNEPASTRQYRADMGAMHGKMDIEYTGNADLDFVNGMIPHHDGAIAMAQTQLKYGKDERLRRMAKSIIAAQTKEVRFMKDWRANQLPSTYKQIPPEHTQQ